MNFKWYYKETRQAFEINKFANTKFIALANDQSFIANETNVKAFIYSNVLHKRTRYYTLIIIHIIH